jgi:flagellar basal-body rod modification protein FlgD
MVQGVNPNANVIQGQKGPQATGSDAFKDLNLDTFIQLLVSELQNQDPMNPMDNAQILNQVSQIRAIESNTRLTDTLGSVLRGQNVATASSLLGKKISGLTDKGDKVQGVVDRVTVADDTTTVHVGTSEVSLKNIGEILPQ